jgi:hypothetical protein
MKEQIEGTKGVIRICKSKKGRQPNDQEKNMYNETNNDLPKNTQNTDDRETRTL